MCDVKRSFSLGEKIDYYKRRKNDPRLTEGQRKFAERRYKQLDKGFNHRSRKVKRKYRLEDDPRVQIIEGNGSSDGLKKLDSKRTEKRLKPMFKKKIFPRISGLKKKDIKDVEDGFVVKKNGKKIHVDVVPAERANPKDPDNVRLVELDKGKYRMQVNESDLRHNQSRIRTLLRLGLITK